MAEVGSVTFGAPPLPAPVRAFLDVLTVAVTQPDAWRDGERDTLIIRGTLPSGRTLNGQLLPTTTCS